MFGTTNLQIYDQPVSHNNMNLVERIKENVLNNYNYNSKHSFKWANNFVYNTTLYSGEDRKSTFYTDPNSNTNDEMMTMENETLREKLHNAEQSLSLHVKKCENLIIFFTNQIQTLTDDLEQEKSWRTNQLTKIVKALMTFESKLRNDQKLILNQLCAKDSEINKLASELVILNERCGLNRKINVNEAAQYCLSCRKQYYRSEMVNASTQSKRNQNGDESSTPSVDYMSTSEDGTPSFFEARRSKRYTSKRTSGTFKEYSRSRSANLIDITSTNDTCSASVKSTAIGSNNATDMDKDVEPFKSNTLGKTTQFESTEDWYASASDMDDSDNALSKPYGTNAVNPVLECVNQILLQQSFDGMMEKNTTETADKEVNLRQKRVHFSTQNSMLQVPRDNNQNHVPLPREREVVKEQSFSYESIYSNEYEPIGSENVSSHHYVDMENKSTNDESHKTEKLRTPPALPPKPANLMKLKHVLGMRNDSSLPVKPIETKTKFDTESEPDYCSISEVDNIKTVKIVADVHKSADSISVSSEHTEMTEESFADIPKLPNVKAIVSPKKNNSGTFIAQDNYITKSPAKQLPIQKRPPNIVDIRIKKPTPIKPAPTATVKIIHPTDIKPTIAPTSPHPLIINNDLPIQAEFDWYNLDAEYGKFTQSKENGSAKDTDVELESQDVNIKNNVGIEYNLDMEFNLGNGVVSVHEEDETDAINEKSTEPCINNIKSFQTFLDDTGLATKPLPRQRKIYYTAPFV